LYVHKNQREDRLFKHFKHAHVHNKAMAPSSLGESHSLVSSTLHGSLCPVTPTLLPLYYSCSEYRLLKRILSDFGISEMFRRLSRSIFYKERKGRRGRSRRNWRRKKMKEEGDQKDEKWETNLI
jgi:hypothetical protein